MTTKEDICKVEKLKEKIENDKFGDSHSQEKTILSKNDEGNRLKNLYVDLSNSSNNVPATDLSDVPDITTTDGLSEFEESGSEYEPSDSDVESTEKNIEYLTLNNSLEPQERTLGDSFAVEGVNLVDDENMYVTCSDNKDKPKKLYCMFCSKFQSKFARHFEAKHKDETEVKKFICLPKGCQERKNIIDRIKKKCQFYYNTNSTVNDGELLVVRRPHRKLKRGAAQFKVCQNCKGFFSKNNICNHAANCFSFDGKKCRTLSFTSRKIEARIHPEASDVLKKTVFPVLRDDNIVKCVRYDRLLILYGNKMCCKYRLQHQHDLIRSNLRLLGRLILTLKMRNGNISEFADIYDPEYFDDIISAINIVAGLDEKNQLYETPAVAYNLGSLIKKIGNIKRKDKEKKENAEAFLKVLVEDLAVSVNKTVTETQAQKYRRKKVELPSKDDIKLLYSYLNTKRRLAVQNLSKDFSIADWNTILETSLISIQLFNRRRAGELERMLIDDFKSYEKINKDLFLNLSTEAKNAAKNYVRFYIRGKLGRSVPVLLSQEMLTAVELILKFRNTAGVPSKNKFLFGIPSNDKTRLKYLRACELLRKYANDCGAKFPSTLRGTTLRKHVATNCVNLNLSENEISDVADFMGHSKEIHKQHYRQPIISREIVRMSRILEKAQGIDYEENSSASESEDDLPCEVQIKKGSINETNEKIKKKRSTSPYGSVKKKKRWSAEENETASKLFGEYLTNKKYPSLKQIQKLTVLKNRNPCVIKTWISNHKKKCNE